MPATLATAKITISGTATTTNRSLTVTQATVRAISSTDDTRAAGPTEAPDVESWLQEHSPSTNLPVRANGISPPCESTPRGRLLTAE